MCAEKIRTLSQLEAKKIDFPLNLTDIQTDGRTDISTKKNNPTKVAQIAKLFSRNFIFFLINLINFLTNLLD